MFGLKSLYLVKCSSKELGIRSVVDSVPSLPETPGLSPKNRAKNLVSLGIPTFLSGQGKTVTHLPVSISCLLKTDVASLLIYTFSKNTVSILVYDFNWKDFNSMY